MCLPSVNIYWSYGTAMTTPGAYVMQHHYSAYDDDWEWRSTLVTGDDLELPGTYDMAWDGPLEAEVTW